MTLVQRLQSPMPAFFKKLRKVALILAAAGGAVLAAPVALPAAIVTIATYFTVVGSVVTAVSQATTQKEETSGQ